MRPEIRDSLCDEKPMRNFPLLLILCLAWLAAPAAGEALLSAVAGDATVNGVPAELQTPVDPGNTLVTGPESSCSVLVDKKSLIQVCGRTALKLREDDDAQVVVLEEGSARAVVGPRTSARPLEIHTPLAVAQILGTIIDSAVNRDTGTVVFALEEGSARVSFADPTIDPIVLNAGEQVNIRPGEPPEVGPIKMAELLKEVECLDQLLPEAEIRPLRLAALDKSADQRFSRSLDRIARADIPIVPPAPVGSGPEGLPIFPLGPDDPTFGAVPPRDNECLVNCDPNVLTRLVPDDPAPDVPPARVPAPPPTGRFPAPPPCVQLPGTFCNFP